MIKTAEKRRTKEYWVRFRSDTFASYAHKLKLTADEELSTPYDCKRDDYIADYIIFDGNNEAPERYDKIFI